MRVITTFLLSLCSDIFHLSETAKMHVDQIRTESLFSRTRLLCSYEETSLGQFSIDKWRSVHLKAYK